MVEVMEREHARLAPELNLRSGEHPLVAISQHGRKHLAPQPRIPPIPLNVEVSRVWAVRAAQE